MKRLCILITLCLWFSLHSADTTLYDTGKEDYEEPSLLEEDHEEPSLIEEDHKESISHIKPRLSRSIKPRLSRSTSEPSLRQLATMNNASFWSSQPPQHNLILNLPLLMTGAIAEHKSALKLNAPTISLQGVMGQQDFEELRKSRARAAWERGSLQAIILTQVTLNSLKKEIELKKREIDLYNKLSDELTHNLGVIKLQREQRPSSPGLIEQHGEHINGLSKLTQAVVRSVTSLVWPT